MISPEAISGSTRLAKSCVSAAFSSSGRRRRPVPITWPRRLMRSLIDSTGSSPLPATRITVPRSARLAMSSGTFMPPTSSSTTSAPPSSRTRANASGPLERLDAERRDLRAHRLAAHARDHRDVHRARHLHGGGADAAARAVHEQHVTGAQARLRDDRVVGRQVGLGHRCRVQVVEDLGHRASARARARRPCSRARRRRRGPSRGRRPRTPRRRLRPRRSCPPSPGRERPSASRRGSGCLPMRCSTSAGFMPEKVGAISTSNLLGTGSGRSSMAMTSRPPVPR